MIKKRKNGGRSGPRRDAERAGVTRGDGRDESRAEETSQRRRFAAFLLHRDVPRMILAWLAVSRAAFRA